MSFLPEQRSDLETLKYFEFHHEIKMANASKIGSKLSFATALLTLYLNWLYWLKVQFLGSGNFSVPNSRRQQKAFSLQRVLRTIKLEKYFPLT